MFDSAGKPSCAKLFVLILAALLPVGCSQPTVVTGAVSFQEEPVGDGTIQFIPAEGRATSASISDGGYEIGEKRQLEPGDYQVRIYAEKETGRSRRVVDGATGDQPVEIAERVQFIPPQYNTQTTLSVTIDSGANQHDFKLD